MTVYEALRQMRQLTKDGKSFSFSFMSFNSTTKTSDGIIQVENAKLRKRTKKCFHRNNDIVEEYLDINTNLPRRFYQPLLMTFNDHIIELR